MSGAVAKSFEVLEALSRSNGPVRLSALAADLGFTKSTAHRVLSELIELGYAEQIEASGLYRPTLRAWEIGSAIVADLPIKQIAATALHELRESTGETVSLVVRSGDDALYLDKIVAPRPIRFTTRVGSRRPLPLSTGGRAILAHSHDAVAVVQRTAALRGESSFDTDRVMAAIDDARRLGHAIAVASLGITGVAAAVLDRDETPAAALAVSAPTDRLTDERRDAIIDAVVTTATRLSESLGRL